MQLALDVARIVLAAAGFVIGAYQASLIRLTPSPGQRWRLAGVAGALAILSASRVQNLGQPITWQFVGTTAVVAALAYGSWKFRDEIPAQPKPRPGPYGPITRHQRRRE